MRKKVFAYLITSTLFFALTIALTKDKKDYSMTIAVNAAETTENMDGDIVIVQTSFNEEDTLDSGELDDLFEATTELISTENTDIVTTPAETTKKDDGSGSVTPGKKPKIGWYKEKGKKYYYVNGKKAVGWKRIEGKYYFFEKYGSYKGSLAQNKIRGTKKDGYYYIDKEGIRVTSKSIKRAVSFVRKNTKNTKNNQEKLKEAYKKICRLYDYKKTDAMPSLKKLNRYSNSMLGKQKVDSYGYAVAVAYVARVLGYDSRVVVGSVYLWNDTGLPHGYAEIKIGKRWYIFDAYMQDKYPKQNFFKKRKKNYKYKFKVKKNYSLTVKNGRVTWK